jgi:hypothetical protein
MRKLVIFMNHPLKNPISNLKINTVAPCAPAWRILTHRQQAGGAQRTPRHTCPSIAKIRLVALPRYLCVQLRPTEGKQPLDSSPQIQSSSRQRVQHFSTAVY